MNNRSPSKAVPNAIRVKIGRDVTGDPHVNETPAFDDNFRRLVPVDTAAKYLGVSRATVERLVHRGELPIVKIGGSTRYDVGDLDDYIAHNRRRNRKRSA